MYKKIKYLSALEVLNDELIMELGKEKGWTCNSLYHQNKAKIKRLRLTIKDIIKRVEEMSNE